MKRGLSCLWAPVLFLLLLSCGISVGEIIKFPSGVSVDFKYSATTPLGSDLVWTLSLKNSSRVSRTCRVTLDANSLAYTGKFLGDVSTSIVTNVIRAGEAKTFEMKIPAADYGKWSAKSNTFELSAFVGVEGTKDVWLGTGRTILAGKMSMIMFQPVPPVKQGKRLVGTVTYRNPFTKPLRNVKVFVTADEGLSRNGKLREDEFIFKAVPAGEMIKVSTNYVPSQIGTHGVSVLITADKLAEVEGYADVVVEKP